MKRAVKNKAPRANTLEEANKLITKLWAMVEKLQSINKQQSEKIKVLEEKHKSNSKNSSLPPSKDKSSKNKSNVKRNAKRKAAGRKRGGQPGHKKHERTLLPPEEVDYMVSCLPKSDCACGGRIKESTTLHRRHQQYEFPVIKPIVTEYQIYLGVCQCCAKQHRGQLPESVSWSMLGPRATAITAHLSGTYRMSKQNIVNLYGDFFNFNCSTGMICKAEQTVSRALSTPIGEAKEFIQTADSAAVNADETGFKEQGKRHWAWVAISLGVAIFLIRKNRSKQVAQELLGENFTGILCSDRYNAYNWVGDDQRQLCWAHLERDFRKISERTGTSAIIGESLLIQSEQLFHHWHLFAEGKITRQQLQRQMSRVRKKIKRLLMRGKRSRHQKTAGTCRTILAHEVALWRFIEMDGIEPTNNLAEQKIRSLVIWQKTSFGTQSKKGSTYMERIMSVVATCRLQGRNILDYLTSAVQCFVKNLSPPSLLPANSNNPAVVA